MRLWGDDRQRGEGEEARAESDVKAKARPGVQITERDLEVLGWVSDQYCVRADVLRHLLGRGAALSESRTRAVLGRWCRADLVVQRRVFAGLPLVIWPTRGGQRLVRPDWRWRSPSVAMMAHHHQVSVVRLALEQSRLERSWVSERVLLRSRPTPDSHVPDGLLRAPEGDTAVEVELTQKSSDRLRGIVRELAMDYPSVLYVAADATIAHAVEAAARSVGEEARIRVERLEHFTVPGVG